MVSAAPIPFQPFEPFEPACFSVFWSMVVDGGVQFYLTTVALAPLSGGSAVYTVRLLPRVECGDKKVFLTPPTILRPYLICGCVAGYTRIGRIIEYHIAATDYSWLSLPMSITESAAQPPPAPARGAVTKPAGAPSSLSQTASTGTPSSCGEAQLKAAACNPQCCNKKVHHSPEPRAATCTSATSTSASSDIGKILQSTTTTTTTFKPGAAKRRKTQKPTDQGPDAC